MNWLIFLLSGIIIGLIGGVLIDRDTVNKYYNRIRKIKTKGEGNVVNVDMKQLRKEQKEKRRLLRRSKKS